MRPNQQNNSYPKVDRKQNKKNRIYSNARLRNDLYCVKWDVKLYYTIPRV